MSKTSKTTNTRPASNTAAPSASASSGRETFVAAVLAAYGTRARTIKDVAKAVKAEGRAVRAALDGARRRGWKVKRAAPCTFQLTPPRRISPPLSRIADYAIEAANLAAIRALSTGLEGWNDLKNTNDKIGQTIGQNTTDAVKRRRFYPGLCDPARVSP